ncbi:MAG TPA: tRNA lysidine(34) synthetase TilS [Candidatus Saccharimonadales bacterium]|nr:tRNA lysidine(34) synthetase TilS [Candidatus Saccharimonadales bacterium]
MINVKLKPGRYVVAVSGGVDSMVLLDILRRQPELELLVAHVNHGIRKDSQYDEELVRKVCTDLKLTFRSTRLNLKGNSSEEVARNLRYAFLQQCSKKFKADAILVAHHKDDLVETALINIIRGTGWRGLAPFVESRVLRPLLDFTKDQIIGYARKNNVVWREDSTNSNEAYLRNYIRLSLIPALNQKSQTWDKIILQQIRKQQYLSTQIDVELEILSQKSKIESGISRYWLIMLPKKVAYELLQFSFKKYTGNSLQQKLAESTLLFAKVAKAGKVILLGKKWQLAATKKEVLLQQI